jgi:hypothetical protein
VSARRAAEDKPIVPVSTNSDDGTGFPALAPNDSSYERDLVKRILAWAAGYPHFDAGFAEKMQNQIDAGRPLSSGQVRALENIIREWRVD